MIKRDVPFGGNEHNMLLDATFSCISHTPQGSPDAEGRVLSKLKGSLVGSKALQTPCGIFVLQTDRGPDRMITSKRTSSYEQPKGPWEVNLKTRSEPHSDQSRGGGTIPRKHTRSHLASPRSLERAQ